MCWQNYNTLKNTIIELTFFNMDYTCNTWEALTLAPDLHQIDQPEKKKRKKKSEAGHVNVSYLLFKLFLIVGLKEGVNQHLKQHRVPVID